MQRLETGLGVPDGARPRPPQPNDFSRFLLDPRLSRPGQSGNAVICGDNLAVLGALEPSLRNTVRCIYIDPPYNNQESYTHYEDALPHEEWLAQITPRLQMCWRLLRTDGSLWISIDDREMHYLRVALDAICGRDRFVATIVWEHRISRENRRAFSHNHEYILVYAKDPALFRATRQKLPLPLDVLRRYQNPDDDPRGPWQSVSLNVQAGHGTPAQFYDFTAPNGRRYCLPNGRCWAVTKKRLAAEIDQNNVWFGRSGRAVPRLKKFLLADSGLNPETLWLASEVGTTSDAKKHLLRLFPKARQFDTPKPETLIGRILHIASAPGDLVIDAYLGSGTTAAVAHKMQRRYLGIDMGKEACEIAARRLGLVIQGERGGVSESVRWSGGGDFKYFRMR